LLGGEVIRAGVKPWRCTPEIAQISGGILAACPIESGSPASS
jgi:hypothetical protein